MHLITSHLNTDFDSLASMIAIQKLYPDAVICPPGIMNRKVKDFMNHYGREWKLAKPKQIPMDQVTLMVVVDTRARSRIGIFAALAGRQDVTVHVFDHHPPTLEDLPARKLRYAPIGATVTMIVEQLLKEHKSITPEEATLFALGIYDDTGALTFESTTERDIYVVGRLREIGADLSRTLSRIEFSGQAGMTGQTVAQGGALHLMDILSENARECYINGAKVLLTWAVSDEYVDGLALLMHRLREYCYSEVTIAVVRNGAKKINIIARSVPNVLNVKDFLSRWGGSGHLQAGSATIAVTDVDTCGETLCKKLLDEIERVLHSSISQLVTVESVMTSPVLAVAVNARADEAYRTMLRFGYRSLPVIDEDKSGSVVGIITRRDLDRAHLLNAASAGQGQSYNKDDGARIRDFMTEGIISISSKASLEEAHRLMATYGFERLPVLEHCGDCERANSTTADGHEGTSLAACGGGRLVGILTRADLVRGLYHPNNGENSNVKDQGPGTGDNNMGRFLWMESVTELMEKSLSLNTLKLLRRIGAKADSLGMKAYLVGGTVRDILMGVTNVDIDIAVEGGGGAEELVNAWNEPGCHSTVHGRYKTGTITFPDGQKVDIATARREFYEYAAALPVVASDSLKQDVGRRDFSVNAMALSLSPDHWGLLLDYYGGRNDLREGILKILHNLSFVEDPSRILRGIRLEQRLGLRFEDNTMRFLKGAIEGGILALLSAPRLRAELELNAKEPCFWKIALRMKELGVWETLFPGIKLGADLEHRLKAFHRFLAGAKLLGVWENSDLRRGSGVWLVSIAVLLKDSRTAVQSAVLDRLCLSPAERKELRLCLTRWPQVVKFCATHKNPKNSEVYMFFREDGPVQLLTWLVYLTGPEQDQFGGQRLLNEETTGIDVVQDFRMPGDGERVDSGDLCRRGQKFILRHVLLWEPLRGELTGRDLIKMGLAGEDIGRTLMGIRLARMDGLISTRQDEIEYVQSHRKISTEQNI